MSMDGIIPYVLGGGGGGGGSSAATVAAMISGTEDTATASQGYSVGEYFIYNDALYIVTSPISQGDTITPGTNCDTTTVCENLSDLFGAISDEVTARGNAITATQNDIAYVLGATTAGVSVQSGSYVIYNNALYKATQSIASTDAAPYTGKIAAVPNIGEDIKFLNNFTLQKNLAINVPASGSATIHFSTTWAYSFLLCTKSTTAAALTDILFLVAGYVSASRGKAINISGNSYITIDMTSTSTDIVINNSYGTGVQCLLIPLDTEATYTFS